MGDKLAGRKVWTSLHKAAARPSDVRWLEELLKYDATKINQQTRDGKTPLLIACQYKRVEVAERAVSLLLQYGANVNMSDKQGRTPLLYASMKGKLDAVVTLLNSGRSDPDLSDCCGRSPMHVAAFGGHWKIVKRLLHANGSVPAQNIDGVTPIYLAAKHGRSDCLKKLLQVAVGKGQNELVDLRAKSRGITPLMAAAKKGNVKCIQILLEYNANPNLHTVNSSVICGSVSALHLAVYGDHVRCVKLLLEKMGLQRLVHHACVDYVCPLQVAVDRRSHESQKMLLSLGFPVDNVHRIPASEQTFLCHLFYNVLPDYQTSLSYAAGLEDIDSMKILLDHGASVNSVSVGMVSKYEVQQKVSFSPVLRSLCKKNWKALALLIEHDCDISYQPDGFFSNVCLFLSLHDYDTTKKLLMCGSNPNLLFQHGSDFLKGAVVCVVSLFNSVRQEDGFRLLELLLQFTVINGQFQAFFRDISIFCQRMKLEHCASERWKAIQQQVDKPSSLENLCRIKIRQVMISVHGYSSFRTAIHDLCLPQMLKEYLLYSDLNEKRKHA